MIAAGRGWLLCSCQHTHASSMFFHVVRKMAFNSLCHTAALPNMPKRAFHPEPSFVFPKKSFGKKTRSYQATYFKSYPLLTYDVQRDFCYLCVISLQEKKMNPRRADPSFIERGFSYWKDATSDFKELESSKRHKEAVQVSIILRRHALT